MQDYKTGRAIRSAEDEAALHSFFSPYVVPTGLNDEEALVCIALYPFKKAWEKRRRERIAAELLPRMPIDECYPAEYFANMLAVGRSLLPVPDEFVQNGPMTRLRFAKGIRKTASFLLKAA